MSEPKISSRVIKQQRSGIFDFKAPTSLAVVVTAFAFCGFSALTVIEVEEGQYLDHTSTLPFVIAFCLVEVIAAFTTPFKSWRRDSWTGRKRLIQLSYGVACIIALFSSTIAGLSSSVLGDEFSSLISKPAAPSSIHWFVYLRLVLILAIDHYGIGAGLSALMLSDGIFLFLTQLYHSQSASYLHLIPVVLSVSLFIFFVFSRKNNAVLQPAKEISPKATTATMATTATIAMAEAALAAAPTAQANPPKFILKEPSDQFATFKRAAKTYWPLLSGAALMGGTYAINAGLRISNRFSTAEKQLAEQFSFGEAPEVPESGFPWFAMLLTALLALIFSKKFYSLKLIQPLREKLALTPFDEKVLKKHIRRSQMVHMSASVSIFILAASVADAPIAFNTVILITIFAVLFDWKDEYLFRSTSGGSVMIGHINDPVYAEILREKLKTQGIDAYFGTLKHRSLGHIYTPYLPISVWVRSQDAKIALESLSAFDSAPKTA